MAIIPKNLLSPCAMKRVICHWTSGNYKANDTDLQHYHILIEGDGTVRGGDHPILANVTTSDNDYAAHTQGANTGAIGIACCCMVGSVKNPYTGGSQPMKKSQWDIMVQAIAELCLHYGIPVTPTTVLGHGEVQANLQIAQNGKWDPMVWPWDTTKTSPQVGAALRQQVSAALAKLTANSSPAGAAPQTPVTAPTAAAPLPEGQLYTLRSPLLANHPVLRRIAETTLVLVQPAQPQRVEGVEIIQQAINRLSAAGLPVPRVSFGTADKYRGCFGPQTADALRAFQRLASISIDGKIGDETLRALDTALLAAGLSGLIPTASVPSPAPVPAPAAQPPVAATPAKPAPAAPPPPTTAADKPTPAPKPPTKFTKARTDVFDRGIPGHAFLHELVAWAKTAPDEIFIDKTTQEKDVYASIIDELGPFQDLLHRKACMLEVMRVLAGFESSWKWNEGIDVTRASADTPKNSEAGAWQVSSDSLTFGKDLKDLVQREVGSLDGIAFQKAMKSNHPLAMEYIARLMRHTMRHNGPLRKDRSGIVARLQAPKHSIYPWLSPESVAEFQAFLT